MVLEFANLAANLTRNKPTATQCTCSTEHSAKAVIPHIDSL